jgi:hypothetical protein
LWSSPFCIPTFSARKNNRLCCYVRLMCLNELLRCRSVMLPECTRLSLHHLSQWCSSSEVRSKLKQRLGRSHNDSLVFYITESN